jgi:hypothetical protein
VLDPAKRDVRMRFIGPDKDRWRDRAVLPKLRALLPPAALQGGSFDKAWKQREGILYFADGSWWDFLTHDMELDAFASVELDSARIDEEPTGEMGERQYSETVRGLIDRAGNVRITLTPVEGIGWLKAELADDRDEPLKTEDAWCVTGSIEHNPHISSKGRDRAKKVWAKRGAAEYEARATGRWVHREGLIFPEYRRELEQPPSEEEPAGTSAPTGAARPDGSPRRATGRPASGPCPSSKRSTPASTSTTRSRSPSDSSTTRRPTSTASTTCSRSSSPQGAEPHRQPAGRDRPRRTRTVQVPADVHRHRPVGALTQPGERQGAHRTLARGGHLPDPRPEQPQADLRARCTSASTGEVERRPPANPNTARYRVWVSVDQDLDADGKADSFGNEMSQLPLAQTVHALRERAARRARQTQR